MMTRSDGIRTVSMVAATSIAVQGGLGSEPAMATSGQVDIRCIVRTRPATPTHTPVPLLGGSKDVFSAPIQHKKTFKLYSVIGERN